VNRIDIVIPCAGRVQDLLRLLDSIHTLCAESLPLLCASITVTDDRPTEDLREQVARRFPSVKYVAGPMRGPAANRNHGSTHGRAEWLLFLDDDCYLKGDLLQAYATRIATHLQAEVIEGAIHAVGERPNGNHHAPLNTTGGVLWSCNLLVKRRTFEAVGRFDEEFPFACLEDCDLADRLKARCPVIVFAEDAVVFHPWRSVSVREVSRAIISHAIYAEKHPEFAQRFNFMHLLRALRGRLRQYRLGRFSSIPRDKYRTVAFDLTAPVVVYVVIRVAPLRRVLWNRYRNRTPATA
jgi:GT2 family glycosyltransferase